MPDPFVTPWLRLHQAPLSMRFPRQEYWSGLPCLLHWLEDSLPLSHLGSSLSIIQPHTIITHKIINNNSIIKEQDSSTHYTSDIKSVGFPYQVFLILTTQEFGEAMAPYSSTFGWRIPWMEEPGRLKSMGSLRVRHN